MDKSSPKDKKKRPGQAVRKRMTREERYRQLIATAWQIVREDGTAALTLGRLAEQSMVAKPVVYDHFPNLHTLLIALYKEFDNRQTSIMDMTLEASEPTLAGRAAAISSSYVDCVLVQGREIPGIIAALASSPELEKIKRSCQATYMEKCRIALTPFAPVDGIPAASLWAMLGAAEALSQAAALGELSEAQAKNELYETIVAIVRRTSGKA
ncbi:TetR/AcrR family transcriptional regulator [Bordetella bronchialis]|uniref:TetR family transcriptional regulator n=1 Tax=Bordetella bronchialis TaxID=463025 RepID=A0ABN4QWL5_9BORD|nr:TetR/AcrR family transcriptional regulator [Bordetella bronchialis]ANN65408.1 TetR family transcriptional regulator [Bordetella bronchialis]